MNGSKEIGVRYKGAYLLNNFLNDLETSIGKETLFFKYADDCTIVVPLFWNHRYRGYYTGARRYEFYVRVAKTISHEWAQWTCEILLLPWELEIHILELTCNVFSIIQTY